jgi:hypothetical protein
MEVMDPLAPVCRLVFLDPLPVMRLVSVSGESGVCPGRSTDKQHSVLLMAFKNQDSLLNRESAESFILDLAAAMVNNGGGH